MLDERLAKTFQKKKNTP